MKALRFHAPGDVRLEEVPEPVCGDDEIVIAVRNCSACGTDSLGHLDPGATSFAGLMAAAAEAVKKG